MRDLGEHLLGDAAFVTCEALGGGLVDVWDERVRGAYECGVAGLKGGGCCGEEGAQCEADGGNEG